MVLSFSINKDVVKGHLDNNFSLLGRSILRIITNYLNAYLNTGSYRFGPDKLPGLVIVLSFTMAVLYDSSLPFHHSISHQVLACDDVSKMPLHLSIIFPLHLATYLDFTVSLLITLTAMIKLTDPHCYREGKGHIYHGNSYRSF